MKSVRLQKYLSQAGVCSRRKGEEYILQGRVFVNGKAVTTLGTKVDPRRDRVVFDGKPVAVQSELVYIAVNKPRGYVTSCRQQQEKIVLDLVPVPERLYPVGRLDKDSTGLLLLTNDGSLHQRLSHPSFDHEKEYEVQLANPISNNEIRKLKQGVMISGRKTRPAVVVRISDSRFKITLKEGRNRQIRRMAEAVGNRVVDLKRIRIATLRLGSMPEGSWRHLSDSERQRLVDLVNKSRKDRRSERMGTSRETMIQKPKIS